MSQAHSAKAGFVREADGFEGAEYAVMTALIVGAVFAALVGLGVALNGDIASLTQVVRF
jgi:Flp pilus assembly pilin Flp